MRLRLETKQDDFLIYWKQKFIANEDAWAERNLRRKPIKFQMASS